VDVRTKGRNMSEDDLDVVVETGERLPIDLFGDLALWSEAHAFGAPVFDGERVVIQIEE
jgi:hypothetical protein